MIGERSEGAAQAVKANEGKTGLLTDLVYLFSNGIEMGGDKRLIRLSRAGVNESLQTRYHNRDGAFGGERFIGALLHKLALSIDEGAVNMYAVCVYILRSDREQL